MWQLGKKFHCDASVRHLLVIPFTFLPFHSGQAKSLILTDSLNEALAD